MVSDHDAAVLAQKLGDQLLPPVAFFVHQQCVQSHGQNRSRLDTIQIIMNSDELQ